MKRIFVCLLFLCAACSTAPTTQQNTPTPSAWSAPVTLAQTQQTDAPALVINNGALIAAWVGSDARGVHQDVRSSSPAQLSDVVTLPLPPTHPYNQSMFQGDNGNLQLLWLDAGKDDQTTLYSALIGPNLNVVRGPVSVSDGLALNYSAVPDGSGGLWAIWSGGQLSELSLYMRHVDDQGRPLLDASKIASNATNPALISTNRGDIWAFWLSNGQLMRQSLSPSGAAAPLTSTVSIASGDRLINVVAALDASNVYFFWDITRANGVNETWMTAGSLSANVWRQPEKLSIKVDTSSQIQTGFKLGSIDSAASGGDMALRWAEPLSGQYESVAVAVESDAGLGIVTLKGGDVIGYTTADPGVKLIGLPDLALNVDGNFALSWSEPGQTNANLQLITTQK